MNYCRNFVFFNVEFFIILLWDDGWIFFYVCLGNYLSIGKFKLLIILFVDIW